MRYSGTEKKYLKDIEGRKSWKGVSIMKDMKEPKVVAFFLASSLTIKKVQKGND